MIHQGDATLLVEKGINDVSVLFLEGTPCLVGSSPTADIVLDNPYVSRMHVQFLPEKGSFRIRDLGSTNGTFVNGLRIEGEGVLLRTGDRIELAPDQVVFKFHEQGKTVALPAISQQAPYDLVVDPESRDVWVRHQKVEPPLSHRDFDILNLLYQRRGAACSKEDIAAVGWPDRVSGDVRDSEVKQYIRRIRQRIEPDPSHPQYLLVLRGYGYKLSPE